MTPAPVMTTEEYLRTPETLTPTELIYGTLRVADAPTPRHQSILFDLAVALRQHVVRSDVGKVWIAPIDVILDRDRALIVQPDLIFVSHARMRIVTDRVWGPPDLVVEVLSPHPRIGQIHERLEWFARYGVRECWLLQQMARQLEILRFADGRVVGRTTFPEDEPIRSEVLPEFTPALQSIVEW